MGKTIRRASKDAERFYKTETVRDGTFTRCAKSCENNGSCAYCRGNRTHKNNRRKPVESVDTEF